jgi:hypothetical protein
VKELDVDKLYTVHRYFNQVCSDAGIQTELVVNENDLKVILSTKPISEIFEGVQRTAIANSIVAKARNANCGSMVLLTSDNKINTTSTLDMVEGRYGKFYRSLNEALDGIAVPDGAAQPKVGVEMLEQALSAQTRSGTTLKDALKKAGITWHVAEPGSHVIVFKGKSGDEKWRVEPMTLSDKKVFEETMAALWSVALGKSPNAKKLELDAAKQHAKELGDHQKEISGLVDQITGKYAPPAQEEENVTRQ